MSVATGTSDVAVHDALARVFHVLTASDIDWCVLRGENRLGDLNEDVDLLVAGRDVVRLERALAALSFLAVPQWGRGTHTFYFAYYAPEDAWIKLDVVTELAYGPDFEIRIDVESEILARRLQYGQVNVLDPSDAFWSLLLHCLYDVGAIEPDYRYRLHQLSGHALRDGPFLRCLDGKLPEGWDADRVVRSIREQQWSTLEQLPLVSRDGGERRHRTSVGSALRRGAFMMRRAQYRLRRPGLSLALLGPDGAGKSTLAEDVRARFLFPVQVIYMGNRPQSPLHIGAIAIPGSSLFRRLLRIWMNMGRAIYHRSLGRLVIFDRYTYDQSRELSDDASMVERAYFWMLTHSTPAPDRVFILDAPGQVMYDRKGEWSPYELEVQRAHFLSLRDRLANVEVVDASRDPTAMRRDVLDRIWRQYVSRWAP